MQVMIGELLDAARLHVGEELELNLQYVDVVDLVRRVVQHTETMGRTVRLEITDAPFMASVDPARFERALESLLSNALKYSSDQSPIDVHVRQDVDTVIIKVRDRGFGIPADELPRVTTPFSARRLHARSPALGWVWQESKRLSSSMAGS
jgi:signal transduction histidine kinase